MKGVRVLITGGLGFIGSNLARKCLELGAEVTIYDCLDPHSGGKMFNIKDFRDRVKIVASDILHFDDVCSYVMGQDIVFNCAASTSHPFSMREPLFDIDVNSKGIINLLEAARRFNRNAKIVHLGTTTQIGKLINNPANELHPEFPMDIYSANKMASEKYVLIYNSAYNMSTTVVRLPNVFGPRATIHSSEFNFVNYFIGLSLQGKTINIFGDGAQLRNVLYVDDCVSALIAVALKKETDGEVLFAVGDEHYSVADIAKTIIGIFKSGTVKFIDWPKERKVTEVGDAVISNKKIKDLIQWKQQYSFNTGLTKTKEYFSSCLTEYIR